MLAQRSLASREYQPDLRRMNLELVERISALLHGPGEPMSGSAMTNDEALEYGRATFNGVNRPGFPRHFPGSVNVAFQTLPVTAGC